MLVEQKKEMNLLGAQDTDVSRAPTAAVGAI